MLEVGGFQSKWGHRFTRAGLNALEAAEAGSTTIYTERQVVMVLGARMCARMSGLRKGGSRNATPIKSLSSSPVSHWYTTELTAPFPLLATCITKRK